MQCYCMREGWGLARLCLALDSKCQKRSGGMKTGESAGKGCVWSVAAPGLAVHCPHPAPYSDDLALAMACVGTGATPSVHRCSA
jgi:hypothetical protein